MKITAISSIYQPSVEGVLMLSIEDFDKFMKSGMDLILLEKGVYHDKRKRNNKGKASSRRTKSKSRRSARKSK